MVDAGSIFIKLGLDPKEFLFGIDKAKYALTEWRDTTNKSTSELALWGAAIARTAAPLLALGYTAHATYMRFGQMAQGLKDLSYQTGVSVEYLQKLQYAAAQSGTNFGTVTANLNKLTLQMGAYANGSAEAKKAFDMVGITPTGKPVQDVFEEMAMSVAKIESPTQRAAAAMALLGRNGKELLPFIESYVKNLKEISAIPVFSEEQLDRMAEIKSRQDTIGQKIDYFIGANLFPDIGRQVGTIGANPWGSKSEMDRAFAEGQAKRDAESKSVVSLIDKYAGLSEEGLRYQSAVDEIADAQEAMTQAIDDGDKKAFDAASKRHQQAILDFQKLREEMAKTAAAATGTSNVMAAAWSPSSVVGSAGSEMQLFMQQEMELGTSYEQALQNWMYGSPTNKNPTPGTLAAVGKKAIQPGTKSQTSEVKAQTDAQATAYDSLNTRIMDGYAEIEASSLKHYTRIADIARMADENVLKNWADTLNWINGNIAYQQIITVTNGVSGADPMKFAPVSPPALTVANFGEVKASEPQKAGGAGGTNSGGTTITNIINVSTKDNPQAVGNGAATAISRALNSSIIKGGYS